MAVIREVALQFHHVARELVGGLEIAAQGPRRLAVRPGRAAEAEVRRLDALIGFATLRAPFPATVAARLGLAGGMATKSTKNAKNASSVKFPCKMGDQAVLTPK